MKATRSLTITLATILAPAVGALLVVAPNHRHLVSTAVAQSDLQKLIDQSKLHSLIDKLRGLDMPAGVVKTNGRIEATQVDIAAKYPGRLESVTVVEGDEVAAGQTIAI